MKLTSFEKFMVFGIWEVMGYILFNGDKEK